MKRKKHLLTFAMITIGLSSCGNNSSPSNKGIITAQSSSMDGYQADGTPDNAYYDQYAANTPPMTDANQEASVQSARNEETAQLNTIINDSNPNDNDLARAILGKNSFTDFDTFLYSASDSDIGLYLNQYGVGYGGDGLHTVGDQSIKSLGIDSLTECPQYFPYEYRNKILRVSNQFIGIDAIGRPWYAAKMLGARAPTSQRVACQTTVGTWGVAGDVGGHMIASTMDGFPGRANLFPQNGNFNNSPWKVVENSVRRCLSVRKPIVYRVNLTFSGNSLRPDRVGAAVTTYRNYFMIPLIPQAQVGVGFSNSYGGGPTGLTDARNFAQTLSTLGCNGPVY